ncbi:MAG TPA: hypothetical protein GX520_02385 [Syntrophaceticus sp.]|nr:hypothetical protein [Syntrophaceticus sp.]
MLKAVFFTAVENDLIPLTTALKRIRSEKGQVIDVQARTRRDLGEGIQFVQFKELAKEADQISACAGLNIYYLSLFASDSF